MNIVSHSNNISLYPSIVEGPIGILAAAWYSYGSPEEPTRSDIHFSLSRDGGSTWIPTICVSKGISYNNGPSLVWNESRNAYYLAWHSWRPPGKEPLTPGGDVNHIWISRSEDGVQWSDATMAIKEGFSCEYASLAVGSDGNMWMAFFNRVSKELNLSSSEDGLNWNIARTIQVPKGNCPDLLVTKKNEFYLSYALAGEKSRIGVFHSSEGREWKKADDFFESISNGYYRPKITLSKEQELNIIAHTSSWGGLKKVYKICVSPDFPFLSFLVRASGFGGDAFWNLSYLKVRGDDKEHLVNFGPLVRDPLPNEQSIFSDSPRFGEGKTAIGFDNSVREMLRELGTPETRGLVYSKTPTVFQMALDPGEYEVEIQHSSWISSSNFCEFEWKNMVLFKDEPRKEPDHCVWIHGNAGNYQILPFLKEKEADNNRPTGILFLKNGGRRLAWTRFDKNGVKIMFDNFDKLISSQG